MNFKINIIKKKKEKQSYLYLFLIFLFIFAISSCASTASSNTRSTTKPEKYNLEIDKTHLYLAHLYYRDIISFNADEIIGNMITYDAETNLYYVPGKTAKTITSGSYNIEFVKISVAVPAGFTCVSPNTILYSDANGDVYKTQKNSKGKWEENHLFTAKHGKKPFTAMTADQKNIYFYSKKDNGIYRFNYSGKTEALIKINGINISAIDIKSNYLYMLDNSGLIFLADYEQNKIEMEYMAEDHNIINTTLLVRQAKTETEIILNRNGIKDTLHYGIYPLSSLHKMVLEEGYIKRVSPRIAGCSYVLSDSNGKIIFPIKSTLVDLETALSRKVTVIGMIHDIENTKIVIVSAIDN